MTVEGDRIGAYRVRKQIGAGGMGEVWLAEHSLLKRRAAIKLLHPSFSSQPDIVARFFNEARAATTIADPGIVQIFDFGHDNGVAYIVMEMLDGETLEARRHRGISLSDALRIMRQVSSSLGAAHSHGIIHRDLKPENIFLVRDPEVGGGERAKILDFGIAKLTGDSSVKTQTSAVMGTPTFMSPEQCRGAGLVDQRSDVYSLGCVLFTILAGRSPFEAEGVGELIVKHITEPAPRASSFVAMPAAVDDLIACCLDKDPARRYASGAALAAALGALVTDPMSSAFGVLEPDLTSSTTRPLGVIAALTTLSGSTGAMAASPRSRRRAVIIASSAAAVLAGGLATWAVSQSLATVNENPAMVPSPPVATATQPKPVVDGRRERAANQIRDVLVAFSSWATTHMGAPCPSIDELSKDAVDPWGHRLAVTCTEQPANQVIGVTSPGPDGQRRTDDDLASWLLGHDVTTLVDGARWVTAPVAVTKLTPIVSPSRKTSAKTQPNPVVSQTHPTAASPPAATIAPTTTPPASPSQPPAHDALPPLVGSDGLIRKR